VDISEENWDELIDINLKGVLLCSQSVSAHMIKQRRGKIVNIGSASSRGPVLNLPQGGGDYCISKAGVHVLTKVLAWELAPYGINVNCVAPGPTETPMHTGRIEVIREKYRDKIPLGRIGMPQDIANVVTFLVTDASNYITGQTIHVNGGMLMVD
jgi:NAD(P)-dependent dehydrogenase (short-subunit alcohol dehydrogenase family)